MCAVEWDDETMRNNVLRQVTLVFTDSNFKLKVWCGEALDSKDMSFLQTGSSSVSEPLFCGPLVYCEIVSGVLWKIIQFHLV